MLSDRPWKVDGIIRLMVGMLVSVCFIVLLRAATEHLAGKARFADGAFLSEVFNSLAVHGSILIGTTYLVVSGKETWADYFGFTHSPGRAMRYGALVTVAFVPVGMVLQELSLKAITHFSHATPDKQAAVAEFSKAVSWPSRTWFVLFAVVIGPIAEEILFRGIIYGILRQARLPRFALWISAVLFAAAHAQQNDKNFLALAAVFVPLLILGLLFAWLYDRTDNLLSSITAHSLFNGINIALMFLLKW